MRTKQKINLNRDIQDEQDKTLKSYLIVVLNLNAFNPEYPR